MTTRNSCFSHAMFTLALVTGTAMLPGFVAHAQESTAIEPSKNTHILAQIAQNQVRLVNFYRYYNPGTGDHFYTTNINELGANGSGGYVSEGIAGRIYNGFRSGTTPFYRYYNASSGDHFYTTNINELGVNGSAGYVSEGVAGYIFLTRRSGTRTLYRYYNAGSGDHFYTTNINELGANGSAGYVSEGVAGYIFP